MCQHANLRPLNFFSFFLITVFGFLLIGKSGYELGNQNIINLFVVVVSLHNCNNFRLRFVFGKGLTDEDSIFDPYTFPLKFSLHT